MCLNFFKSSEIGENIAVWGIGPLDSREADGIKFLNSGRYGDLNTQKGGSSKMATDLLDLHGVQVDQVMERLDRFLVRANAQGLGQVRIMTGKGTGKVQAKVIDLLKQAHYPWRFEKSAAGKENTGILIVQL